MAGVADIVLQIGSSFGPGGLASLKAGLDMLSNMASTVGDFIKELDRFRVVMKSVDMDMVNYADSMAQGQIDTFQLMKSLQKMNQAGVKISQDEFKTLAVRVVEMSKATGEDATESFKRLSEGISKATAEALAPYGEKLKATGNLQKDQRQIIDKLTKGYEDNRVALESLSEGVTSVKNNLGTFISLLSSVKTKSALSTFANGINKNNEMLSLFNSELSNGNDNMNDYLWSLKGVYDYMFDTEEFDKQARRREKLDWVQDQIDRAKSEVDSMESIIKQMGRIGDLRAEIESMKGSARVSSLDELNDIIGSLQGPGLTQDNRVEALNRLTILQRVVSDYRPVEKSVTGKGPTPVDLYGAVGISPQATMWANAMQMAVTPENMQMWEEFGRRFGSLSYETFFSDFSAGTEEWLKEMGVSMEREMPRGIRSFDVGGSVDERMAALEEQEQTQRFWKDEEYHAQIMDEYKESQLEMWENARVERAIRSELLSDEVLKTKEIANYRNDEFDAISEANRAAEYRLELLQDESYQEALLSQMRQNERVAAKEEEIRQEYSRQQSLDFGVNFAKTWNAAFASMNAGALAANSALDLMHGMWSAIITTAVQGNDNIRESIGTVLKTVGTQIAIEAGLKALEAGAYAIFYLAQQKYDQAAEMGVAVGLFGALAAIGGGLATTGKAMGHSAKNVAKTPVRHTPASPMRFGSGDRGDEQGYQEIIIRLAPDSGSQMFEVIRQQNRLNRREGSESFQEA